MCPVLLEVEDSCSKSAQLAVDCPRRLQNHSNPHVEETHKDDKLTRSYQYVVVGRSLRIDHGGLENIALVGLPCPDRLRQIRNRSVHLSRPAHAQSDHS